METGNGTTEHPHAVYCKHRIPNFELKFYLVMVGGTCLAALSAVENSIVFHLFNSRARFRSTHTFFMKILALMDVLVAVSYLATFPVEVMMNAKESLFLSRIFHSYIRPLFTISQVALTASTFLILAASLERYTTTCRRKLLSYTQRMRQVTAGLAVLAAFLIKGTVFFETTIVELKPCNNHRRFFITYSSLGKNWYFNTYWMFWLRHIFTVFLPFISIAFMNFSIVKAIRSTQQQSSFSLRGAMIRATVGEQVLEDSSSSVRKATRMLLLVVASYLGANVVNVAVAVWEHVDLKGLLTKYVHFYSVVTDIISLLTILATALRLPIYLYCNVHVRHELKNTININGRVLTRHLSRRGRPGTSSLRSFHSVQETGSTTQILISSPPQANGGPSTASRRRRKKLSECSPRFACSLDSPQLRVGLRDESPLIPRKESESHHRPLKMALSPPMVILSPSLHRISDGEEESDRSSSPAYLNGHCQGLRSPPLDIEELIRTKELILTSNESFL